MDLTSEQLAYICVNLCEKKKAENILLYEVNLEYSLLADYFLICTANSEPHIRAITRELDSELDNQYGIRSLYADGAFESHWFVLDYGPVLAHIFMPEMREKYNLEELWTQHKLVYENLNEEVPEYSVVHQSSY